MSKVYRSIDQSSSLYVKRVDVGQTQLTSTPSKRPQGGFFGAHAATPAAPPMSLAERREHEAHQMIEEAQSRAESIQKEAYRAGFEEGERAGRKLARQKMEPALQMLSDIVQAISQERSELMQQHRSDLIKIAFLIATQVVHKQVEMDPEITAQVVLSAMSKVTKNQKVTIHLASQDLQVLQQLGKEGQETFLTSEHVRMEADETIGRGGCRISTETGDIDATIEGQLRVMTSALW